MNQDEYLKFAETKTTEILKMIKAKNADYANSADAFANFNGASDFGVDPLVGLALRMSDKFQRIKSFSKKGVLQVKGEPVQDAFSDLIGYSLIALAMLHERKANLDSVDDL